MLNQAAYNQAQRRKRKQAKRQNLHTQRRDAQRQTHLYELANQALHHQHTLLSGQLLACPAVLTAAAGLTNLLDHLHRTHRRSAEPGHARRVVHPKKSRTGTFGDDAVWVALIAEYDLPIAQRQALIQIVADGYVTASTLLRHVATARPSDLASSLEDLMRLATEHRPHTTTTTTTTTATAA